MALSSVERKNRRLHKTGEGGGKRLRPQYVTRASVALPFVMALGFALAAISALLVQRFGYVFSNWMVAGGLALIGVIATIAVSVKQQEEEI